MLHPLIKIKIHNWGFLIYQGHRTFLVPQSPWFQIRVILYIKLIQDQNITEMDVNGSTILKYQFKDLKHSNIYNLAKYVTLDKLLYNYRIKK